MEGLTKENVKQAFQELKRIEEKNLNQKMFVIRFFYASLIFSLLAICVIILIKA